MPTKKSTVPPEIFQLKVTLLGTIPPIWRQLLVPANLTLAQLHDVLQTAMDQAASDQIFVPATGALDNLIRKIGSWERLQSRMSTRSIYPTC